VVQNLFQIDQVVLLRFISPAVLW